MTEFGFCRFCILVECNLCVQPVGCGLESFHLNGKWQPQNDSPWNRTKIRIFFFTRWNPWARSPLTFSSKVVPSSKGCLIRMASSLVRLADVFWPENVHIRGRPWMTSRNIVQFWTHTPSVTSVTSFMDNPLTEIVELKGSVIDNKTKPKLS